MGTLDPAVEEGGKRKWQEGEFEIGHPGTFFFHFKH